MFSHLLTKGGTVFNSDAFDVVGVIVGVLYSWGWVGKEHNTTMETKQANHSNVNSFYWLNSYISLVRFFGDSENEQTSACR